MNPIIRSAMIAGSFVTLAACGVIQPQVLDRQGIDSTAAKNVPDQGNAFQRSLHQGYADFGRWEYQQADFRDAKYYNDKARMAAAGQNVQPVDPTRRDIKPEFRSELLSSRDRLMQSLGNQDTLNRVPGPAGAAQVYYDCWAEQAEEGHQPEHIAYCKQGFETAMGQLTPPRPVAQAPAPAQPARPYIVFFDWDRYNLAESSTPTINEIASSIKQSGPVTIRIAGHADKSGPTPYNDNLSQRRAESVLTALERQGVRRNQVTVEHYGESRPLVDTPDGVREAQNRRVEITFR